jgi:cathepsin A (carboxypeptidase C)
MKLATLALSAITFLGYAVAFDTLGVDQKSELLTIGPDAKDEMFYWLFYSKRDRKEDPLVIWLTGGPGCASEIAVMTENGPYKLDSEGNTVLNEHSWHTVSNMLYIDNPIGVGFSSANKADEPKNEDEVAEALHTFLINFIKANPEFSGRDLFITGESYAGHYIPAISYELYSKGQDLALSFKGAAIGNGWVDPYHQYPMYAKFALENHLIDEPTHTELAKNFETCQYMIKNTPWYTAFDYCDSLVNQIVGHPKRFNVYNIKEKCSFSPLCYDFSPVTNFCNNDAN